jgi:Fur family peroxide stress response transcriptional regulator
MKDTARKHSKKREAILQIIRSTPSHPSARWVHDQLKTTIPGLSLGTVYRNIKLFLEEGSVVSVGVVGGEERFDGFVRPHPHLICTCCGAVFDLPDDFSRDSSPVSIVLSSPEVPGIPCSDNREKRFLIDYQKTMFYGVCFRCANLKTTASCC